VPLLGSPAEPEDKAHIGELIAAARRYLDGRHGRLGRALITQTWTRTLATWPRTIDLAVPPVQSVDSIEYVAPDGTTKTLDPGKYRVRGLNASEPATIRRAPDTEWPEVADDPEAITVTFTAGYGDTPADVPEPIRHAIKLLVTDWFEKRSASMIVDGFSTLPTGVEEIITQYREWSF
jgi:uncharacterized phiE125 gp8 family phage protein